MSLHDELEGLFRAVFANDSITLKPETTARDIAEWDSLGHVNIMFAIEETFGVRFRGDELAEFRNIGELESFLATNRNGTGGA